MGVSPHVLRPGWPLPSPWHRYTPDIKYGRYMGPHQAFCIFLFFMYSASFLEYLKQHRLYAAHFLSLWESKVAVWPAVTQRSDWAELLPLKQRSEVPVRNVRGNRETEVVSGKQSEVSLSGQFQFQGDLIHLLKVTALRYHKTVTSYRMWSDTDKCLLHIST